MQQRKEEGIKKQQQNSGEEAVEMAKALCELSTKNDGSSTSSMNQEFDNVKTETIEERKNCQFSGDNGNLEELISSIQVQLPPLKSIPSFRSSSNADEKIYINANFYSFAQFKCAFEEWKRIFHHPFRVASSGKLEDQQFAERFKYSYVVYHCSHYGWPRKRGAGRRSPHQNYLPCGCNAILRLNFHQKNGGSLCVTKLFTEHNHDEPISEGMLGRTGGMKRCKSSPENEFGAAAEQEPSLNSTASSIVAAPINVSHFSPLSLQTASLHHSPCSSGGQSSSESAATNSEGFGAESIRQIINTLINHQHQQDHQKLLLYHHFPQQNGQQSPHFPLISPLAKKDTGFENNFAQQIPPTFCSSSSTSQPSALPFHQQLQKMLINSAANRQQCQQKTPNHPTINPQNAQLLLQQLLLLNGGANSAAAALPSEHQQKMSGAGFSRNMGHPQQQQQESTTLGGRQQIIQEADLLLQMLVGQMLQCRDLGAYLGRLRQFLAENCCD